MANIYVYSSGGLLLGILEGARNFVIERKLYTHNKFTLEMHRAQAGADLLVRGRFLALPHDATALYLGFRIDQIETETDDDGMEIIRAQGREAGGLLDVRIIEPPAGQSHDIQHAPAETAIKHYVSDHAGPTATNVNRRTPGLSVVGTMGRGITVHTEGRFQTVAALIEEIGVTAGVGWEFRYNTGNSTHVFDTIHGVDRSTSVTVDITLDSARAQKWLTSDANVRNAAIVAGQGEGTARQIVKRYQGGVEPSGWDRREQFVDARDLNDTQALQTRGDASISEAVLDDRYEAEIYAFGSFRYQQHWDMGDIVKVRNLAWSIDRSMRVVSVTLRYSAERGAEPEITVGLDKPWPTLAERDKNSARSTGGAASHGAVDYHAENHAARHATGGPDALSPSSIGAIGATNPTTSGQHTHNGNTIISRDGSDIVPQLELMDNAAGGSRPVRMRFHRPGSHYAMIVEDANAFSFRDGAGGGLVPIDASNVKMNGVTVAAGGHTHTRGTNVAHSGALAQLATPNVWTDMPDMTVSITTTGGAIHAEFVGDAMHTVVGGAVLGGIDLDGQMVYTHEINVGTTGHRKALVVVAKYAAAAGPHTVKARWLVGQATGSMYNRTLSVWEV